MAKRTNPPKSNRRKKRTDPSKQQYDFSLNPYPDSRCSTCPNCNGKTGQRKLPLFVHVEPQQPIVLNYTCRYCPKCNLLIGHKHEIESNLTYMCMQLEPSLIGNDYTVMGVIERQAWRENQQNPKSPAEMLEHFHGFTSYSTIQRTMAGWFHQDVEPPIEEPPPSREWVKGVEVVTIRPRKNRISTKK